MNDSRVFIQEIIRLSPKCTWLYSSFSFFLFYSILYAISFVVCLSTEQEDEETYIVFNDFALATKRLFITALKRKSESFPPKRRTFNCNHIIKKGDIEGEFLGEYEILSLE